MRSIKILVTMFAFMAAPGVLCAQGEIGLYPQYLQVGEEGTPQVYIKGYSMLSNSEKFCIWGNAFHTGGYSSGALGPCYSPMAAITFGVALGGEKFDGEKPLLRLAGDIFLQVSEKCSAELYYERGASRESWWAELNAYCQLKRFSPGILYQRGGGVGPQLAVQVWEPIEILAAPMYDGERWNFLAGVQVVFRK